MTDYGRMLDPRTVQIERMLPGPIERVWDHLTKGVFLRTWLGDIDAEHGGEIEPRVGATIAIVETVGGDQSGDPARNLITGVVTRWDPPRALAYTWAVDLPPNPPADAVPGEDSIVTFELEPKGKEVRLTVTHARVWRDYRAQTASGWHALLDTLQARLEGREPERFMDVFTRTLPEYERRFGMEIGSSPGPPQH
jgi:uncharacterized protein YndB with AHSA1/START domain